MPKCGFNKVSHGNFHALIQVSLRIQSECGKIRTRKNSVFGHFSCSVVTLKCVVNGFSKNVLGFVKIPFSPMSYL